MSKFPLKSKIKNQKSKILLVLISLACSSFSRPTTFDDRQSCEKTAGVWREFGNGCVDGCEAKLNQFSVCTMAFTYGCECGKSRCWDFDQKSCVALKDYKKIFDARVAEEKKIAEAAKKKREEEAKENQQTILKNLSNNNAAPNQNNSEKKPDEPAPVNNQPSTPTTPPTSQIPSPVVNDSFEIPPLFLQKEQEKKDAEEKKKKEQEQQTPAATIPGLPVIPLPQ